MERAFTEAAVKQAIDDLAGEKCPGPDGFCIKFYSVCWHFMKSNILAVVSDLFYRNFLDWRLNSTFISLVPKSEGKKTTNDFCSIALLSCLCKVVDKVLANRLKSVLPKLVSETQCVVVEGRHIQDLSLMANELVDSRRLSKQSGLLFMIDIFKAFDQVSWNFLDDLMVLFGFSSKWCCLKTC